ncbi:Mortality factor 4-like protein 1 [Parelaphostrongylus tenuis]|uniref:Mortality factor 4-like protein 1 n=1 Tax=Parelaphostrongylus tenuis TaxID=148309 RepID=A0AAD5RAS9_PARTN|nr:Mortality factor 4-like protein 1 [Parelaphostrongylus tenuis]
MGSKRDHRYKVNDRVLCKHGLFFYEAKIIEIEEEDDGEMIYTVHYQGWHKRYDERIHQKHCSEMFLPLTDANIAKAKADIQEASSAKNKRKKQKLDEDEARKSETGSRGSTPSDRAGSSHAPSTHSDRRSTTSKLSEVAKKGTKDTNEQRCMEKQFGPEIESQLELLSTLPRSIKKILVDDYDAVVNQGKLAVLPARVTVYDVVQKYIDFSKERYGNATAIDIEMHGITRVDGVNSLRATAEGLRDYFDIVLGYQLLYKFEKPQYNALSKSEEANYEKELKAAQDSCSRRTRKPLRDLKPLISQSALAQLSDGGPLRPVMLRPSKFYGLPHLLRMFVKLPALLRMTSWDEDEILMRIACIHDFISFLRQNAPFILSMELDYKVAGAEYTKTVS